MLKRAAKILGLLLLGGLVTGLAAGIWFVNNQPDLSPWHEVQLSEEFTEQSEVADFAGYLALEERLFAELDDKLVDRLSSPDSRLLNRYYRNSPAHPDRWAQNWNRSFELPQAAPRAGVLLLHGMSDSPYSLRSQGLRLHAEGAWVLGLRIPGHGTAPAGLVDVSWQDMAAAVRLAMTHLSARVGERPITIVGYSNGGALGVQYALSALSDDSLTMPANIVLISPAIGVTALAAFAIWQERIGGLLGLDKLQWNSVLPEYNPFKYQSFAVNAGDQTYRLTAEIAAQLERLGKQGQLQRFPPVLAFQSAADATVSTPALITGLMDKLPENGHELVVFDINKAADIAELISQDPEAVLKPLLSSRRLPFTLTLLGNRNAESDELLVRKYLPGDAEFRTEPLGMRWPDELFSLSHVALPFAPDDPLYGKDIRDDIEHVQLGMLSFRGERGVLSVSSADMLRLTWNPFHAWMQERIQDFVFKASTSSEQASPQSAATTP